MRDKSHGFTVLELLTTMTIVAVLLGIGVPSFTALIRQNRLASHTNEFILTLAVARSEAVKRGGRTSICSSNAAQTACSGATDWGNGWLIFSDPDGAAGTIDPDGTAPDDTIVQAWPAPTEEAMNVASARAFISYGSDGRADVATVFTVSPHSCTGNDARTISVSLSGRASKGAVPCP
jgi:type IV fimbrial biogenesis protein FimT